MSQYVSLLFCAHRKLMVYAPAEEQPKQSLNREDMDEVLHSLKHTETHTRAVKHTDVHSLKHTQMCTHSVLRCYTGTAELIPHEDEREAVRSAI